jgi:predicted nucleic acid-binding protein
MIEPVFVDANVLLYAYDPRDPVKQARAREWIDRLWDTGLGRVSTQVLSEFYANAKKFGVSREKAWETVATLLEWNPRAIDAELLSVARDVEKRHRLSWWESMIVAAAQLEKCRLLLTEDLQDGAAIGPVIVRSPFTLKAEQPAAGYAARPMLALVHRPRGRPRRSAFA